MTEESNVIEAEFTATDATDEGPDLLAPESDFPSGISWPENLSAEEAKELYTQCANKGIEDFVGTQTWVLFQFASPSSIQFGVRTSEPKPSNEALYAVLSRIVRELDTLHRLDVEEQRMIAVQASIEAQQDAETELVDGNGLVVLRANREQKRHPEKFGLTRRPKRRIQ